MNTPTNTVETPAVDSIVTVDGRNYRVVSATPCKPSPNPHHTCVADLGLKIDSKRARAVYFAVLHSTGRIRVGCAV